MRSKDVLFKDLKIGDIFFVYGDIHINYDYPKICKCIKIEEGAGKEIEEDGSGVRVLMGPHEKVSIDVE